MSHRERRMPRRGRCWRGCLAVAIAAGVATLAAAEPTAVLDLAADGFLPGRLGAAPAVAGGRKTIVWQSPLFAEPIEFAMDGFERIRFPKAGAAPQDVWQVELQGGDFVAGELESIDADHVVLRAAGIGTGTLRLRRAMVERLSRADAAGRAVVPGGLDGWQASRGAWAEQGGRLVCSKPGSTAYRDVAAPPRACFEILLSWEERPDLELLFAAGAEDAVRLKAGPGGKKKAGGEEYRLELTAGDLLPIRATVAGATFEVAGTVPAGAGTLHLLVFVDQQLGRLAVVPQQGRDAGRPVFDDTLAPRKPTANSGFGIRLRQGDVRIDRLRVLPWADAEPRRPTVGGPIGPDVRLESFVASRDEFTVRDAAGSRTVPARDVPSVELQAPRPIERTGPGVVLATFHRGGWLSGRILEVTPTSVLLDCPASADPVPCGLGQLSVLESTATSTARGLPGRVGVLEMPGCRMLGCLATTAGGIGWQPLGAVGPVTIPGASGPLSVSYRGLDALGGVGLTVTKQGNAWKVTEVVAGGPAAREGRIRPDWRLEAIGLEGMAGMIDVESLEADEIRGLLRGVAGSTVRLRVAAPGGQAEQIALVRDASGRGDLAGAAEKDLLDKALKMQDARRAAPTTAAGNATLYLKTGDSIVCTVRSADPTGLRIQTDMAADVLVPAIAIRAVELQPGPAQSIAKDKFARLLTLPRMQQADPPTHLLRLPGGDYLRGKLVSLDESLVRLDVLGRIKELPRSDATRLIWLSVQGDDSEARALAAIMGGDHEGVPARVTTTDGRRLTLAAERIEGDRLVGTNAVLGATGIDLGRCDLVELAAAVTAVSPAALPYDQWKLRPAAEPRALAPKPPVPGDQARVEPSSGAAPAGLAVLPVLPLLEPGADGRRHLSAFDLEGRIAVLALVEVGDGASLGRLPQFAKLVAASEADGVVGTAVVARGSRDEVARAVGDLKPKPPIAIDESGRLRTAWGDPSLPACIIVDREGRIAAVLPLADGMDQVRTRVAELVAASQETHREFQALTRAHERALAGDRGCLDDLGALLTARSAVVRKRACGHLRRLTGLWETDLPFQPDGPPDVREAQVRRWRQWLAKEGVSANLTFPKPLDPGWDEGRPITGHTLVCRPQKGDAVELDEHGAEVSTLPVANGWACDVTPKGNRLVGDHPGKSVVEFDANGREVWAIRDLPGGPMSARRLADGNTLVALSDADLVAEYDPQGKMVWSAKVVGRPCDARRLAGGGTLVAAHRGNRIVEIDATGQETVVVRDIEDPQAVQRLPNGHMLVAMSEPGIVREIDRDGRVVWQQGGFKVPIDAQRLPDGRTLVQEMQGDLVELDVDGTELGRMKTGGTRFLRF